MTNLQFDRVNPAEDDQIARIFEILKACGEFMDQTQGLVHWKIPYPQEFIKKDCQDWEVFLARDLDIDQYIHTFQLRISQFSTSIPSTAEVDENSNAISIATINKFATLPAYSGQGIGKQSMDFIENSCRSRGILKLCLDVYSKSERAIQFYKNRGFTIVGSKPTRHFTVYLMEKML
jgi:ribosomal protein S18 acetylase RimI-like enzyme